MSERYDLERLRAAFAQSDGDPPQPEHCPSTEEIWAGVHGELAPDRLRDVVEHLASCSSCAEAWRIALDLERSGTADEVPARRTWRVYGAAARRTWRVYGALAATAAAAVLAVGLGLHFFRGKEAPMIVAHRGDGGEPQTATQWLTASDADLPRGAARLSWRGPTGTTYDLTVESADKRGVAPPISIAVARGLTATKYTLPARALERLPAGADLDARLTAHLPDGRPEYLLLHFRLR